MNRNLFFAVCFISTSYCVHVHAMIKFPMVRVPNQRGAPPFLGRGFLTPSCIHDKKFPLHDAVSICDQDEVKHLLNSGFDINQKNSRGETPLHTVIACSFFAAPDRRTSYISMIQMLVAAGANIDEKDKDGHTPVQYCGNNQIMASLLNDYQQRIESAKQRVPIIGLTLALGTHSRLGVNSRLALLPQQLLLDLTKLTALLEAHAARQPNPNLL